MANYLFKCEDCGRESTLIMSYAEMKETTTEDTQCMRCGGLVLRVYGSKVPRYCQLKGHYNAQYDDQKDVKDTQKKGG